MAEMIKIILSTQQPDTKLLKVIRLFSQASFQQITENIKTKMPVYEKIIRKEEFYDGIAEVLAIIDLLEASNVPYKILINDSEKDKTYLTSIKEQVSNITLEDFR